MMTTGSKSRVIPGRFPPPGESQVADAIRERRGPERGLTELDGALLHVPPVAEGWNTLLGAVRTKGKLGGDIRELMILRVAAINGAAYEWTHHEPVGRTHGLTTAQLYIVRDIETPLPPSEKILSPLQTSALLFSDASTRTTKIPPLIIETLKKELRSWVKEKGDTDESQVEDLVNDLYVEAAAVTATYNMVSRFLLATDVGGMMDKEVPWPLEWQEHFVPIPSTSEEASPDSEPSHTIHAITLISSPTAPWVVFANSLLTNLTMWNYVVPYFLSTYNVLLHSQRGHGQSSLPSEHPFCTIPLLASDIHALLSHLEIPTPVHSVIGVSQGGAAALAFAALYGASGTNSVVVCDTAPKTPQGNQKAWEDRIELLYRDGPVGGGATQNNYAATVGLPKLAKLTISRWFPTDEESGCKAHSRAEWISKMIEHTDVTGFEAGARALGDYDLSKLKSFNGGWKGFKESDIPHVLLVAGSLDGGGKVGRGLKNLENDWNIQKFPKDWRVHRREGGRQEIMYKEIEGAGHLPMVDKSEAWWRVVEDFLGSVKELNGYSIQGGCS